MKRLRWLGVLLLAGAAACGAAADERILEYHSDIVVGADRWLTVTETIKARAERSQIKHGIYRDFPLGYRGWGRSRVVVPFEVVRVERDGKKESFHTESQPTYIRVYIGSKSVVLKPGTYTYRLTYRTTRQLGFFETHDELYWNVTGNDWAFPIDAVTATVKLPEGVPARDTTREAYTGPAGAKGKNYKASLDANGLSRFRTTRQLLPGEGITIVVTFPKGFVTPPTTEERFRQFLADNVMVLAGLAGLVVLTAYFLIVWYFHGRDPAAGVVIPLFDPPDDMCPAAVRYVRRMGFDNTCFTAAVVDMAAKGYLTISEADGTYTLDKSGDRDTSALSPFEKKAAEGIFGSRSRVEVDNRNHATFELAIKELKTFLAKAYRRRLFFANVKYFVPGVVLSVLTLAVVGVIAMFQGHPEVGFLGLWLSGWSVGVFFLVRQVFTAWKAVRTGGGMAVGGAIFLSLFAVPFCAGEVLALWFLVSSASVWLVAVVLAIALVNILFFRLLKRPTVEGRKVMDAIDGFRMYLSTAERDLLDAAHPPEKTPALFERFLPYALALGVENSWAEKFEDVLAQASREGYSPGWYHGASFSTIGAAGFASSFGGSFSSALSTASTAPGSSSGSGGGGSSGGGGGGGGGGGW